MRIVAQVREDDGADGDLAVEPEWIALWRRRRDRVMTRAIECVSSVPACLGFGSNGGGELLAFDTRARPVRGFA